MSSDRSFESSKSAASSQFDDATRRAERELLQRLRKTQSEIRRVDLWTTFCALATLALGLLFLGVLFDHWILPDGFSKQGRLYFAIFWLVSSVAFLVARLAPVLRRRVNSLYAAKILEEIGQDKHNSTINWLQLRKSLAKPTSSDVQTNEEARLALLKEVALQAVVKARALPNETIVDCSALTRWGAFFAATVAVCALYAILSPKSPFASFARIVAPLAKIERPQALRFESVTPGDAVVFQGDVLEIVAEIPGAKANDVEILYSTEDSRLVDVPLKMESEGVAKFCATLPGNERGFEENLLYRVVVGRGGRFESVSETFRVEVRPQPSFRVEKTIFSFPSYTGLEKQTLENQGDVRALEGTRVEIVARSNYPLENAYFLPDGVETRAVKMTRSPDDPELASTTFELKWKESDGDEKTPEFSSYRLLSQSVDGEKNRDAQNYNVSIVADLPPTIRWENDKEEIAEIPLNDAWRVKLLAEDPDYSLRRVELNLAFHNAEDDARLASRAKLEPIPLPFPGVKSGAQADYATGPTPFVGVQTLSFATTPEDLGLEVGDEIEYWGVAFDSKEPRPNVASTEKRLFVVVPPVDAPQKPNEKEDEQEEKQNDPQNSDPNQSGEGAGEGSGNSESQDENESSENGQNDDRSGNQESNQEQDGSQGESGANQSESEGEEGAESNESGASQENKQSGADGQGGESGEQSAGKSQEDGASEGSSSSDGQSAENESNEADGESRSQGGKSKGGAETTDKNESSSSDPSGDSSNDADGSPASSNSDDSSDGSGSSPSSDAEPIDPETNPGDAFEKILDFAQKTKGISPTSNSAQTSDSQDAEGDSDDESSSSGGSNSNEKQEDQEQGEEDANKNGTSADSEGDSTSEKEKRDLPTGVSKQKPKEDSPRFQTNKPENVDPNVERRQGDVDPNANDFLAQNADPNAEQDDAPRDPNQNIALDPNDDSESVAADSVDPNANEAKGNSNAFNSNAPFEIDDQQKGQEDPTNEQSDRSDALDFSKPPTSGGGNGSSSDSNRKAQGESNPSSDGFGGAEDRDPNQENAKEGAQGSGASDQNSERQGGGGGSGLGEIGAGERSLAPADAPQLQYAEKATNFVLNYLEDELNGEVDPRLLKELGWSEEQLREFLERWKKIRDNAKEEDKEAKESYLDALESVGLEEKAPENDARNVWEAKKKERNARLSGKEAERLKTPERLNERVRAFTRGVAKSNP